MVRERSAKPLCVGSIPTRASTLFLQSIESGAVSCDSCLSSALASRGLSRPNSTSTPALLSAGAKRRSMPDNTFGFFGQALRFRVSTSAVLYNFSRKAAVPSQLFSGGSEMRFAISEASKATAFALCRFRV